MLYRRLSLIRVPLNASVTSRNCSAEAAKSDDKSSQDDVIHHFKPLELYPKFTVFKKERKTHVKREFGITPRSLTMKPDQDWGDVWPTARTFHPGTVPLPVRQGYPAKGQPTPSKWGNAELMKIPNFLHLTPPVIERQCNALRKFCTPWPAGVSYPVNIAQEVKKEREEEEVLKEKLKRKARHFTIEESVTNTGKPLPMPGDSGYFPMIRTKSSYLYSGPSVRDMRARVVSVRFQIEDLNLTEHGRDKLLRLLGKRFRPQTNTITLTVDRCPVYSQNLDYGNYLMTVLRAEAGKMDPWEHEKSREDAGHFVFEGSKSEAAVQQLRERLDGEREQGGDVHELSEENVKKYKDSLETLLNDREDDASVAEYSKRVLKMLGIEEPKHDSSSALNPMLSADVQKDMPPIDIRKLYLWHYQEKKKVVWIHHSWPKHKEWW